MPRFLIVAATPAEIRPLADHFGIQLKAETGLFSGANNWISLLITGVGMVNTAYWMGRVSSSAYDHVINLGVCGAFDRELRLGEVVHVSSDLLCEMGAEDDERFIPYPELQLGGTSEYQDASAGLRAVVNQLRKVRGITVNKVHGNSKSIDLVVSAFQPQVESMEGAAFLRGCETFNSYIQLRAISNYVERRDKSKWQLKLAIDEVNRVVIGLTDHMNRSHEA